MRFSKASLTTDLQERLFARYEEYKSLTGKEWDTNCGWAQVPVPTPADLTNEVAKREALLAHHCAGEIQILISLLNEYAP